MGISGKILENLYFWWLHKIHEHFLHIMSKFHQNRTVNEFFFTVSHFQFEIGVCPGYDLSDLPPPHQGVAKRITRYFSRIWPILIAFSAIFYLSRLELPILGTFFDLSISQPQIWSPAPKVNRPHIFYNWPILIGFFAICYLFRIDLPILGPFLYARPTLPPKSEKMSEKFFFVKTIFLASRGLKTKKKILVRKNFFGRDL